MLHERYPTLIGFGQINNAIVRIPTILRIARNIENRTVLINRLPPEILFAVFFGEERNLINATAVCQRWRTVLLSFPRLWRHAGGRPLKFQAFVQRSKSTPLDVNLSRPSLVNLIVPHTSRLASLTVTLDIWFSIDQILKHLTRPIPTLHTFIIRASPHHSHELYLPSDLGDLFFLHSRKLKIDGISAIRGFQTLPYVTELTWHTKEIYTIIMVDVLEILEGLPSLERVDIEFRGDLRTHGAPGIVTLPHVQEMNLSKFNPPPMSTHFPNILKYLHLSSLTTLHVQALPLSWAHPPIFPTNTFCENFPNFAELPELQIDMGSGEITFQNPSLAIFKYCTSVFEDYNSRESKIWTGLPLHSVRRLIIHFPSHSFLLQSKRRLWLVGLLTDLSCLEHLELGGECGGAIQWLRSEMTRKKRTIHINTLTIRCGEHDKVQAVDLADLVGVSVTVICVPKSQSS